jgi:nitroimidazol reductase NimA-like FMN-containing flavoprotein (pyridoxamine 5'-phosphate oxidase superfamily)
MFKEMRRKDKKLSLEEAEKILSDAEYGVLCLNGEYPYGVPVSFVYRDKCVYIHCAQEGHKLDLMAKDGKACFTAVRSERTRPEIFSADFESAILFGEASLVEGPEKMDALMAIALKYSPDHMEEAPAYIEKYIARTAVVRITAEHVTGKKSEH